MAHELWIYDTDSGGLNVNLCGNSTTHPYIIRGVRMPTPRQVRGPLLAVDPEDLYEDRQIEVTFDIVDADDDNDPDEVYTALSKINGLLRKAREQKQNEVIPTVEVRWRATGTAYYTYFILLGGAVDSFLPSWDPDVLGGEATNLRLTLITKPFGRGVGLGGSATSVSMSNGGGSGTGLLTVWNHDDATTGHDNWVDIAKTQLSGDQPALVRLKTVNHASSPNDLRRFRIAVHASDDVSNMPISRNAENFIAVTGSPSFVDDSSAPGTGGTGGIGRRLDWTQDGTVLWNVPWTYSAAEYNRQRGFYMAVAICCQRDGNLGDWRLRWITQQGTIGLKSGEWQTPTPDIAGHWEDLELGVFRVPPFPVYDPGKEMRVGIELDEVAGSATMSVAALYLFPLDHWLLYRQSPSGGTMIDQTDYVRWENTAEEKGTNMFDSSDDWKCAFGQDIGAITTMTLDPQRDHRIAFLFGHDAGAYCDNDITDRIQVQCWYIPRFLHVYSTL